VSDVEAPVRADGLLAEGRPVVILLSGGRDSVCLLDLAVRIAGAPAVCALHVDYGLRGGSAADAAFCEALCRRLGVPLHVHRPVGAPEGNVQAWARDQRYAVGARLALQRGADVAAGHTATDQVETMLYRLASSPGRRALLGMRAREGRLVRPLLGVTRAQTAAYCRARGLQWREDPSNDDDAFARNRIRHRLVEDLRAVHEAAEANVLRTLDVLRDEAAVLDDVVDRALRDAGWRGRGGVSAAALAELPPALRRLAFQRLAGERAPAVGARVDEVLALAEGGGTRGLDLGGGLRAVTRYGEVAVESARAAAPEAWGAVALEMPGAVAWAGGEVTCERGPDLPVADGTLDAGALEGPLEVRAWRDGDRMRPLGLGGSRSLQDLFTDRKVPREARHGVPVVVSAGEIAWVPGVATGDRFRVSESTRDRVRLSWIRRVAAP
jgi:tRNA(Ile)-lysidine synthase